MSITTTITMPAGAVIQSVIVSPIGGTGGIGTTYDPHAATDKATPVDADELPLQDSAASYVLKKLTWANLKAALQSIFAPKGAATSSGLSMATARLLGRTTASSGAIEEIAVGSGLTLAAGTLSAVSGAGVSADAGNALTVGTDSKPLLTTPDQAEAEAGSATTARGWSALLVRQAISAWWTATTSAAGRAIATAADAAAQRTALGLGTAATTAATAYATAAQGATADSAVQNIGTTTAAASGKTTPVDGDALPISDSVASNTLKKLTWANLKATLKTYFDAIYEAIGAYEYASWSAMLAATGSMTTGREYRSLGAVISGGVLGSKWVWDGSVLTPSGEQLLYFTLTPVAGTSGGTTTEQVLRSVLLPSPMLKGVRYIHCAARVLSNGAADAGTRTVRIRLGTAGTSADAVVATFTMANTNRTAIIPLVGGFSSDTAFAPHFLSSGTNNGSESTNASNTVYATVAVPNISSNALYLSCSVQQAASPADTMSVDMFMVGVL